MKNQIILVLVSIALVGFFIFLYSHESKGEKPVVGEDGKIKGLYSIDGILSLEKPYVCKFEKRDEASSVIGTIYTGDKNIYGDFRISTATLDQSFNSFIIIKNKTTYSWTSLGAVGYKAPTVRSASKNASPEEQAQIVGTREKIEYECTPWSKIDSTLFEIPPSIQFVELRR